MAMAFSLLGSFTGTLKIDDKNVVNKTYPNFWQDYANLVNASG
jgi:5-enolpyruvylshikimate-3-phosphate synthase